MNLIGKRIEIMFDYLRFVNQIVLIEQEINVTNSNTQDNRIFNIIFNNKTSQEKP